MRENRPVFALHFSHPSSFLYYQPPTAHYVFPLNMSRFDFTLPELGIADQPIVASLWHVRRGSRVIEGDSLLEIRCGSVAVDLPAPVSGTLLQRLVREEDRVAPGQRLAVIEVDADELNGLAH
jgi:hypothetical protein